MRWNLLSLFARNDHGTDETISLREREAREIRQLARLARSERMDEVFASMRLDPPMMRDDRTK